MTFTYLSQDGPFLFKKSLEVGEEADWTLGGPERKLTATPKMNSKDDGAWIVLNSATAQMVTMSLSSEWSPQSWFPVWQEDAATSG